MASIKNIVCAISGGVDSCVAALLLKRQGYNVQGVFMRNWDIADEKGYCQADADKVDAEYICKKLNIPFSEVNFVKEYWNNIFNSLIEDYKNGLTPNPDILCNKIIKFDLFLKYAVKHLKADGIATGHYARIVPSNLNSNKRFCLLKGLDQHKDQTFFLAQLPRSALQKCIFPVGGMMKDEVKNIAASCGFKKIVQKKESMGMCFIGQRSFQEFIDNYVESQIGNFINIEDGKVVGQHKGVHCWTVGQRCMIGGQPTAYYVVERNCTNQEIIVAPGRMHPSLFYQTLITEPPYWINFPTKDLNKGEPFMCDFRFQHREPLVKCFLYKDSSGHLQIFLQKPVRALTPGQYAVFYVGDECLGSAKILSTGVSLYHIKSINKIFS